MTIIRKARGKQMARVKFHTVKSAEFLKRYSTLKKTEKNAATQASSSFPPLLTYGFSLFFQSNSENIWRREWLCH